MVVQQAGDDEHRRAHVGCNRQRPEWSAEVDDGCLAKHRTRLAGLDKEADARSCADATSMARRCLTSTETHPEMRGTERTAGGTRNGGSK